MQAVELTGSQWRDDRPHRHACQPQPTSLSRPAFRRRTSTHLRHRIRYLPPRTRTRPLASLVIDTTHPPPSRLSLIKLTGCDHGPDAGKGLPRAACLQPLPGLWRTHGPAQRRPHLLQVSERVGASAGLAVLCLSKFGNYVREYVAVHAVRKWFMWLVIDGIRERTLGAWCMHAGMLCSARPRM